MIWKGNMYITRAETEIPGVALFEEQGEKSTVVWNWKACCESS